MVLEQCKGLADRIGDWERSKRCRMACKPHERAISAAERLRDEAILRIQEALGTKNEEQILTAIDDVKEFNEMYPSIFGRWIMAGKEIVEKGKRVVAYEEQKAMQKDKVRRGLMADFELKPDNVVEAVVARNMPQV